MDVALAIRRQLKKLGCDQKNLARAVQVTDSYISQLLAGKKTPPAPERTDLYERMERFLQLPPGQLAHWAELQRSAERKRRWQQPVAPLRSGVRELVLRKCVPRKQAQLRRLFEQEPFGPIERLVTQKLLGVVQDIARAELGQESWLRQVALRTSRTHEEMRVVVLEFLDTDIFHLSEQDCTAFLEPLIASWDLDLERFGMDVILNRRLSPQPRKTFAWVETAPVSTLKGQPGWRAFLHDRSLSGDLATKEREFLERLPLDGKRPTALYFYRELQNLRDPLHFRQAIPPETAPSRPSSGSGR